jgi:predicted phosphodiesterase
MLVFVHLSDLHFSSREPGDSYELDETIRTELRHDVAAEVVKIGGVSGLLITGDISRSGDPGEYANAEGWLAELCGALGIGTENVWVVPGNHDVSWSAHKGFNEALRNELATTDPMALDARLEAVFKDPESAAALLAPLESYFEFARKYNSLPEDDEVPFWSWTFGLSDQFVLRVQGINSVLISDRNDEERKPRLVLGSVQTQLEREPGTVHLAMCHHPPDWLRDGAIMEQVHVNATVLLTGHEHHSTVQRVSNCIWVAAGALHPDRGNKDWSPRYNILTIALVPDPGADPPAGKVEVCIYPRTWDGTARFVAGLPGSGRECHFVDLDEVAAKALTPIGAVSEEYLPQPEGTDVKLLADRRLRLRHRFGELLSGTRNVIARSMGLSLGEIQRAGASQLADVVIARAESEDRLDELWDLVETGHYQMKEANPYREDSAP